MILHYINAKASVIIHKQALDMIMQKNDNIDTDSVNESINVAIDFYNNYIMDNFDEIYNVEEFVVEMAGAVHDHWAETSIPVASSKIESAKLYRYLPYQFIGFDALYNFIDFVRPVVGHMLDVTEFDNHSLRHAYMDKQIKLQIDNNSLVYYDTASVERTLTSGMYVSNDIMKAYLEDPGLRTQIVECVVKSYDKDRSEL